MFKNIQQKLLITQPLLWNMKIIPFSVILITINIIFLFVGYFNGGLNFSENGNNYFNFDDGIIIFFSVLISILCFILWLVYYFKNNSFKSVYPKSNFSLFKEWILIFYISFLTCFFTGSFYYGKETRVRSYFTKEEAKKRCEILSEASYFIDNSYSNNYQDSNGYATPAVEDAAASIDTNSNNFITYKGKKYKYFSLLNKNVNSYTFFDFKDDSLRKIKIKDWLVNDDKKAIKNVFKDYLAIVKDHNLQASIDENQWFTSIYDFPNYENYRIIGNQFQDENYYDNQNNNVTIETDITDRFFKTINGEKKLFYKYYVPEKNLNFNYEKISSAYTNPTLDSNFILFVSYFAIALSLLLFSFRVTSGRNWLIAIVAVGIINIFIGIISMVFSSLYSYPVFLLLIMVGLFVYFIIVLIKKRGKGISGITINAMLWSIPGVIPLLYFFSIQIYKDISGYNQFSFPDNKTQFPMIKLLEDNYGTMMFCNIIFVVLMMLFYSFKIKKWKGLAEG